MVYTKSKLNEVTEHNQSHVARQVILDFQVQLLILYELHKKHIMLQGFLYSHKKFIENMLLFV